MRAWLADCTWHRLADPYLGAPRWKCKYHDSVGDLTEGEQHNARLGNPAAKEVLNMPRWLNAFTNLVVEAYVPTKPESIATCKQALSDLQHSDTTATVPGVQTEFSKIFEFQQIFDDNVRSGPPRTRESQVLHNYLLGITTF